MHQLLGIYQTRNTNLGWPPSRFKSLNFDKKPYTTENAIKDASIFGMNNVSLREKAHAEDPNLEKLSRWVQAREAGRDKTTHVKRVRHESHKYNMSQEEIDEMT